MIYALGLLVLVAALVIGVPASRNFLHMSHINRNRGSTKGWVTSTASALGWMWTSSFGNVVRPIINYETPSGTEMVLETVTSSVFTFRRYERGMAVEVIFDRSDPGDAYAQPEWEANLRDLRLAGGLLGLAFILGLAGGIYHL